MADYKEGDIVTHKGTGHQLQLKDGAWVEVPNTGNKPVVAPPVPVGMAEGVMPKGPNPYEAQPEEPTDSSVTGAAKAVGTGLLHEGVSQALGLPGDVQAALYKGAGWARDKVAGREPSGAMAASGVPVLPLPTSDSVKGMISALVPDYEPQNTTEKYLKTGSSFLPGALAGPGAMTARGILPALARYGIGPGVASEFAGQAAQAGAPEYEGAARGAASLLAPGAIRKAITPNGVTFGATLPAAAQHAQWVQALQRNHGFENLTPGQVFNNSKLLERESRRMNSALSGGNQSVEFNNARNQADMNRAALRLGGVDAEAGTHDVMSRMHNQADDLFNQVTNGHLRPGQPGYLTMPFDVTATTNPTTGPITKFHTNTTARAMDRILKDYDANALTPSDTPRNLVTRMQQAAEARTGGAQPGHLSARQYQNFRSELSSLAANAPNHTEARTYGAMRDSMDEAMRRTISGYFPDRVGQFERARELWDNKLVLEKAVDETGNITPKALAGALASSHPGAAVRGGTPMAELAQASNGVLKPHGNAHDSSFWEHTKLSGVLAGAHEGGGFIPNLIGGAGGLAAVTGAKNAIEGVLGRPAVMRAMTNTLAPPSRLAQDRAKQLLWARAVAGTGKDQPEFEQ